MVRLKLYSLLMVMSLLITPLPSIASPQATPAPAGQTPPWLGLAEYIPPAMTSVALQDNLAYVGAGPSLLVYDISAPDHPQRLAYQLLPGTARQVLAAPGRVYVLVSDDPVYYPNRIDKVQIYDSTRLPALRWMGEYTTSSIDSVAINAAKLYIGNQAGFKILDVRDSTRIHLLGELPLPEPTILAESSITAIQIQANLAVLTYESKSFGTTASLAVWCVDISTAALPQKIGELPIQQLGTMDHFIDLSFNAGLLTLVQEYEAVYQSNYAFHVIDLSDPQHPAHRYTKDHAFSGNAAVELA